MKERKPVLFEFQGFCFLWRLDGTLTQKDRQSVMKLAMQPDMLYLCDSRKDIYTPPSCLTIFFSSPQGKNFHDFLKHGAKVYYIDRKSVV